MGLISLIFSRDEHAVRILRLLLAELDMEAEHVADLAKAQERLWCQKYDGVFAEIDDAQGADLLRLVRKSKHNRRSIAFALSGTSVRMNSAFSVGAHFVLQKPLAVEKVKRTLKAAHGLMMREQRSHYRHPTAVKVNLKIPAGRLVTATLKDLSQSGAMIDADVVLRKAQALHLRFVLPETDIVIETDGQVTWSDPTGRAGVRFENMDEGLRAQLLQWVMARSMEEEQPRAKLAEKPAASAMGEKEKVAGPEVSGSSSAEMEIEVEIIEPEESDYEEIDVRLRTTLRGKYRAPLKVLAFDHGRPVILNGECSNLSELGVSAELEEQCRVDDRVLLQLSVPGTDSPLVLHAVFRYQEGKRCGFEFIAIPPNALQRLRQSVKELPVE
jgi:c-di-GMP-binding flagellar brake protein YcgR